MDTSYRVQVEKLEKVFGGASDSGFGSAVFSEAVSIPTNLESIALKHYKGFLGKKLTPGTEKAWMSAWKRVYARPAGAKADILSELASIGDPGAKRTVPLLTELIESAEDGRNALSGAFNHPEAQDLCVHILGDGEAMSGIIISTVYRDGTAVSVIALMD